MTWPQPDRRSCGAAALVVARQGVDPAYAALVADREAFATEVLRLHRRLTSRADGAGRPQLPWLRVVGTPPWAVSRELRLLTGAPYAVRDARGGLRTWQQLAVATPERPVAVYVGDRWLPRHVVLVLGRDADAARTYEPASGQVVEVARARWVEGPLRLAGWDRSWLVVAPSEVRPPRGRRNRA